MKEPGSEKIEVVRGLIVDVPELTDELGHDAGEAFLLAGLALIETAVREARESRWWHSLPERLHRTLAGELERGLRVVELGARVQEAQSAYLYALSHDLDGVLVERAREAKTRP